MTSENSFKTAITAAAAEILDPGCADWPDLPTALWELGSRREHRLSPRRQRYSVGSGRRCAVQIVDTEVSQTHCQIERRPNGLKLTDNNSKNGTFYRDARIETVRLGIGDCFRIGRTDLVVMNEALRSHTPTFFETLGIDAESKAESVLQHAINRDGIKSPIHMAIVGSPDDDRDRLASAIHACSVRRGRPLLTCPSPAPATREAQAELLRSAARATLLIALERDQRGLDNTLFSMMLSPSYNIRVIVLASEASQISRLPFDEESAALCRVRIPTFRTRLDNNLKLLDYMLQNRGASFAVADLTERNKAAISMDWARDVEELRVLADNLITIASDRQWANRPWQPKRSKRSPDGLLSKSEVLGIKKSTAHDWYVRWGLSHPLLA